MIFCSFLKVNHLNTSSTTANMHDDFYLLWFKYIFKAIFHTFSQVKYLLCPPLSNCIITTFTFVDLSQYLHTFVPKLYIWVLLSPLADLNINLWQILQIQNQPNCDVGVVLRTAPAPKVTNPSVGYARRSRKDAGETKKKCLSIFIFIYLPWRDKTPGPSPSSSASSPTWWWGRPCLRPWSRSRRKATRGSWTPGSTNSCVNTTYPKGTSRSWSTSSCSSNRTKPGCSGSLRGLFTSPSLWSQPSVSGSSFIYTLRAWERGYAEVPLGDV